jgi:hypothetical protein
MLRDPLTLTVRWLTLSGTLLALGCSSGEAGSSGTFNVPPTGSAGSASDTTSSDTAVETTDADASSGSSTSSTPADTTSTSTGDLPDGAARLEWGLDDDTLDYGAIPVDGSSTNIILVENVGGETATSLATGTIPGDFSFPGGYPGNEGTCGTELGPGETCQLALRFGPTRVGPVQSALVLEYYDGINLGAPTETGPLTLLGGGSGESANLLVNGDAETGTTDPWQVPFGLANWETTGTAFGGDFAFTPTGAIAITALEQTVSLSPWIDETTAAGLRYRVRARARSNGTHIYRVFINFLGGENYIPLANGTLTSWTLLEYADNVPDGVEQATVRIECGNGSFEAGPCEVTFDEVTLQMIWP